MKKLFVCLMAALMLSSCVLTSCGTSDSTSDNAEGTTAADTANDTAAESSEPSVDDLFTVEKENNNGKKFTILTTETQSYEFDAPEYNGEIVNDAVYDRNNAVEDLLGIDFEFLYRPGDWANKDSYCALITNSILANDGAYDIVSGMISCVQPIASTQLFMNVYDLDDINLDNPWWVNELQKDLTINGKLIGFIGDMSLSMYKGLSVIFANMGIIENKGIANPYDLVNNSEWTLDKMIEIASAASEDINGDGVYTVGDDLYGMLIFEVPYRSIQASLGLNAISVGSDGMPVINELTDRFTSAVDKLTAFLKTDGVDCTDYTSKGNSITTANSAFASDKALYFLGKLESTDAFRDMTNDYAILPFPKYDSAQEKYLTVIATATQMLYIPVTTNDPALTGKVCESMSYYSYKDVVPAYYEIALKDKYSRDENTRDMLDIIRSGAALPFEYAYSTLISGKYWPNLLLSHCTWKLDGQIASMLAETEGTWVANIEKALEAYAD